MSYYEYDILNNIHVCIEFLVSSKKIEVNLRLYLSEILLCRSKDNNYPRTSGLSENLAASKAVNI